MPKVRANNRRVSPNRPCVDCDKEVGERWGRRCGICARRWFLKREPLYSTWSSMKQRCYNPNEPGYPNYGGRGITICAEWRGNFRQFKQDMGARPSPKHSIERINNDGNYEPSNCKWATQTEQNFNQRLRKENKSGFRGVAKSPKSALLPWRAYINYQGKQKHLGYYATKEEAIQARELGYKKYY